MPNMPRASISPTSAPSSRRARSRPSPRRRPRTNYQVGTVYYADNFTFDGDLYYIGVNNNISRTALQPGADLRACRLRPAPSIPARPPIRALKAKAPMPLTALWTDWRCFLNGSLMSVQVRTASGSSRCRCGPRRPASSIRSDDFKLSLIDKVVGQQYSDSANTQFYKLGAYNNMDFKSSIDALDNL